MTNIPSAPDATHNLRLDRWPASAVTRGPGLGAAGHLGCASLCCPNKPVTLARDGLNVSRCVGRIAECAPQPIHGDIQTVLEIDIPAVLPDLVAKLLASDQLSRTVQQSYKDLKWLARKTNQAAAFEQFPGIAIDFK